MVVTTKQKLFQHESSSSSSNRFFIEHDCWKTKNSVVECKASKNVCERVFFFFSSPFTAKSFLKILEAWYLHSS